MSIFVTWHCLWNHSLSLSLYHSLFFRLWIRRFVSFSIYKSNLHLFRLSLEKSASYVSVAAHNANRCSTLALCSSFIPWSIFSSSNASNTPVWGSKKLAGCTTNQRRSSIRSCSSMVSILWIYFRYAIRRFFLSGDSSTFCSGLVFN